MSRVLVCGGRYFGAKGALNNALNKLHASTPISLLIEGGCAGADELARDWAHRRGIEVKTFPANWKKHGRAAGPMRNQAMLTYGMPDLVFAFPGDKGTANMKALARAAGVPVVEAIT